MGLGDTSGRVRSILDTGGDRDEPGDDLDVPELVPRG
jgi:hypothetical protein